MSDYRRKLLCRGVLIAGLGGLIACSPFSGPRPADGRAAGPVSWSEIVDQPAPPPSRKLGYGDAPQQFGELRLPERDGPHPLAVLLHGGCWHADYSLEYVAPLAADLAANGIATWTPEYRRLGDPGGGWPGTLADAAAALDFARDLIARFDLDPDRVVLVGHSAGGHLALWLAARHRLPPDDALARPAGPALRAVVGLAAIGDLAGYSRGGGSCNAAARELMGGTAEAMAERYARGDPMALLPLGVRVVLVQGEADGIVPAGQAERFARQATAHGDDVEIVRLEAAGHFDPVAPFSPVWPRVRDLITEAVAAP